MTWWQAIILGVVEGLTEYLPVSSTGHLLVVQAILGIGVDGQDAKTAADAYAICIQGGAILAVLTLYWKRARQAVIGWAGKVGLGEGDETGFRLGLNLIAAFVPAAVIGLMFNDWIKAQLFGPWPVVWAWLVGGLAILAVAWARSARGATPKTGKELEDLTVLMAMGIGLLQCVAMWPGVSRSLVTIVGGVLIGLSLRAAVEFSFLLGVITLGAATVYDGMKHGSKIAEFYGPVEIALGFVFAFVSAVIAVKWMVAYLQKHGMAIFGYYRVAIALVVGVLLLTDVLVV